MSIIEKIKKNIADHPVAFLTTTTLAGVVAGTVLAIKFDSSPDRSTILNEWLQEMNSAGFSVFAFDPAEKAHWLASLEK